MTIEEAIRILDPETSKEALLPYAYDNHQRRKVVDEACRVAADELRKRQWISVEDRLPEVYRNEYGELIPFLVCVKGGNYPFRALYNGKLWGDGWAEIKVAYWMPLPEPPETGGSADEE